MISKLSSLYPYRDKVGKKIKPASELTFDDIQLRFEMKRAREKDIKKQNKKRYI